MSSYRRNSGITNDGFQTSLENNSPASLGEAPFERVSPAGFNTNVPTPLQILLSDSILTERVGVVQALAEEILGPRTFSMGVINNMAAQYPSHLIDSSKLLRELILADVYDVRAELLPPSTHFEHHPGVSLQDTFVVERLRYASEFRDSLASAICDSIDGARGVNSASLRQTNKHRLEYHRLSSFPDPASRFAAGGQFTHLLMNVLSGMHVNRGMASAVGRLSVRFTRLQKALSQLQWDMGSAIWAKEQAKRKAQEATPVEPAKHWIEFSIVNDDDQPMTGELYEVLLPDQSRVRGNIPSSGRVFLDDIPPGNCEITFPNLRDVKHAL